MPHFVFMGFQGELELLHCRANIGPWKIILGTQSFPKMKFASRLDEVAQMLEERLYRETYAMMRNCSLIGQLAPTFPHVPMGLQIDCDIVGTSFHTAVQEPGFHDIVGRANGHLSDVSCT